MAKGHPSRGWPFILLWLSRSASLIDRPRVDGLVDSPHESDRLFEGHHDLAIARRVVREENSHAGIG
jgi:hypothetical protein